MPITWKISPLEHIVICVTDGVVTQQDILDCYDAVERAGALPYRKIIDATIGSLGMSDVEIRQWIERLNLARRETPLGAMAVVTVSGRKAGLIRILQAMAKVDRPLRVFDNIHDARRWLDARPAVMPESSQRR